MRMNELNLPGLGLPAAPADGSLRTGRIVGTTPDGQLVVDYPGNGQGPLPARVLDTGQALPQRDAEVLLFVAPDGVQQPIVLGRLATVPTPTAAAGEVPAPDREVIDIQGRQQVTLRCGKSSISLFADGRIVLKGTRLVSRASESNKIKGAVIALN